MAANNGKTASRRRGPGRPFQPGQSGNPKGAPKRGLSIVGNLQKVLEQVDEESGKTKGQLIAEKYVELGLGGSVAAIENIFSRFHGRPEQGIRLSGDEARPLHVRHSPRDKA